MKTLLLLPIVLSLSACDSNDVDTFGRAASAAANSYYNRPAYYPQPVVQPVAPVYPVVY